jgi:TonB-linked SusC/RagA family outer membrane protein
MKKSYQSLRQAGFLLVLLTLSLTALAQDRTVTGTVKDETGSPLPGVNVVIKGTTTGTATDLDGKYSISASSGATLVFTFIGFTTVETEVGSRSNIDVRMESDTKTLSEVVVTGYTSERKADIVGSVAVVSSKDLNVTPAANLTQQLQGRAPGVVVSGSGAPGDPAKIRIRGIGSYSGASDPLYIIDGVPTGDASRVNPSDVESIQILKDATSASIYGARAANGVVIITTKQGKTGTATLSYDGYTGSSYIPKSYMPDLLNTDEYVQYLEKAHDPSIGTPYVHPLFGTAGSLSTPDYYVISTQAGNIFRGGFSANSSAVDPALYSVPANDYSQIYQIAKVSAGTNWFDEITRAAKIQSHQITASGGSEKATYSMGLNYLNQEGVYKYSGYERYALRVNTRFRPTNYLRLGENFQLIRDARQNTSGGGARGEASAWAQSFRMVPYLPVNDIGGGWGGNGIGDSGNGTNPVAQLYRDREDRNQNWKMTGNVFAEVNPIPDLAIRTSMGIEYGNNMYRDIVRRTYERSENTGTSSLNTGMFEFMAWTWTNTINYTKKIKDHEIKLLAGTEAIKSGIQNVLNAASFAGFDFETDLFMSPQTAQSKGVVTGNTQPPRTLFSKFARIDYTFRDKYIVNATVRNDKSSVFGAANRSGTFPAFGLGYRISEESFMKGIDLIQDLKLRGGWGQMGNQSPVNPLDQYATFRSNAGYTNYDLNYSQNGGLAQGYTAFNASTQSAKWESKTSINAGFDASLKGGWTVTFDWFKNTTNDLLVAPPRIPVGGILQQPFVNLGDIENKGFEFMVSKRGNITSDLSYDASLTFTHYKNKAIKIDDNPLTFIAGSASRLANVWRTQAGYPLSSYYGYQLDGFFNSAAEVSALDMPGAKIGSWRYKDLNGDGKIDDSDKTFIGNPQPDFVMGVNLGLRYKNFDLSSFFVWNKGGELFNYTKYWTEMRVFVGGVSKRVLYDGWTPEKQTGVLPFHGTIDGSNTTGYTDFIRSTVSDYYLESASYFRAKTVQLGYTLPSNVVGKAKLTKARFYIQGQNLFTITNYSGPDPDINIQGGDLYMGLDDAAFPNPRQVLLGLNLTF